jgi:hypothetical protein
VPVIAPGKDVLQMLDNMSKVGKGELEDPAVVAADEPGAATNVGKFLLTYFVRGSSQSGIRFTKLSHIFLWY